jgi:hypothetical protein
MRASRTQIGEHFVTHSMRGLTPANAFAQHYESEFG